MKPSPSIMLARTVPSAITPPPRNYGFQSYISVPIQLTDGTFFGTLCAIDPRPAKVNNAQTIGTFKLFAELIASHLNAIDRLEASQAVLSSERRTSELREQFIAVLGHDLRKPPRFHCRWRADDNKGESAGGCTQSGWADARQRQSHVSADRPTFSTLRAVVLGGGLALNCNSNEPLEPVLNQVVAELRSSHLDREDRNALSV